MSKSRKYKQQPSQSTNHSKHHTPYRNQYVSPFPISQRQASPLQKRMENSPLHIPLAIALKKLGEGVARSQYSDRSIPTMNIQLQEIKNVLQQFSQSLYLSVERELYSKFNIEMKRIIIKYRQTERLLHKVQQTVIHHADTFAAKQISRIHKEQHTKRLQQLQRSNEVLSNQINKEKEYLSQVLAENKKLQSENSKMSVRIQKLQNILLNNMQEIQYYKLHLTNTNKSSNHPSISSTYSYHCQPQHDSMTNSHICNLNQLTPTKSPLQKSKVRQKDHVRKNEVQIIKLKKGNN